MRSRTRNIIVILVAALAVVCLVALNLHSDSADNSAYRALFARNITLTSELDQANHELDRLREQQLTERNAAYGNDMNIETAASTINHAVEVGAPASQIIPTVAYYAKLVVASGKAWTSHVIPSQYLADVVDVDNTLYRLSAGTSWDGQPAVFVAQRKLG